MKIRNISILLALSISLSACAWIDLERRPTQQGNIITDEQVYRLKVGQTRQQVRSIMGDPVLTDTFNPNRYNYVYTLYKGSTREIHKKVIVEFSNDKVSNIIF